MPEANANPEKRFFIDLITRDISLEDAILDLIDNSVDSLIRMRKIDPYRDLIDPKNAPEKPLAEIMINFTPKKFEIVDTCGGISFERAERDIFRFGHPDPNESATLSVFGIGMKRAIFKIGRRIEMESRAADSGFTMDLEVDHWLGTPGTDWKIPIERTPGEKDTSKAGTKITIRQLREEVATIIASPTFENRLIKAIKETYPFYLGRYIDIFVNKKQATGIALTFADADNLKPAIESWKDGNVEITLICGLLPRGDGKSWTYEESGWYLICNGRVIIHADKTKLTEWGGILPQFMPKNRGFLGVIFFKSEHPEDLPWKTTKQGVNTESAVFIRTLKKMVAASRSVIQFQNKMYESGEDDEPKAEYRDSIKTLQSSSATEKAAQQEISPDRIKPQGFFYTPPVYVPSTTSVQFDVKIEDMIRVKKSLGSPRMSNKAAGLKTFKYFMDRECPK